MNPRTVYAYVLKLKIAVLALAGAVLGLALVLIVAFEGRLNDPFETGWHVVAKCSVFFVVGLVPWIFYADFLGLSWSQLATNARELRRRDFPHPGTMWKLMERSRNRNVQPS